MGNKIKLIDTGVTFTLALILIDTGVGHPD